MDDLHKIADWLKTHPLYAAAPLLLFALVMYLLFESAKTLAPKFAEHTAGKLLAFRSETTLRRKSESAMRRLCILTRNRNWASALPSMSRFNLDVSLSEIFVLPRLVLSGHTDGETALSVGEILARNRILCVTGLPGSGKSTLLNSIAIAFATEQAAMTFGILESRIPICFDFNEFADVAFEAPIEETFSIMFKRHGILVSPAHLHAILEKGRCAIFLDGLDEAGDELRRRKILSWVIASLAAFSSHNRLIITCRDFEWEASPLPGVARGTIQPFTTDLAQHFVDRVELALSRRSGKQNSALQASFSAFRSGLANEYHFVSGNPMLLMLAVTSLASTNPPERRSDVLESFLRSMLRDWSALKSGAPSPFASDVMVRLERLGYGSLEKKRDAGTVTLRDGELLDAIANDPHEAAKWLNNVAKVSGVLVRLDDEVWAFSNRRLLEFLSARELSRKYSSWDTLWTNPAWKEVFSFLPEIVSDRTNYVNWLKKHNCPLTDLHALLLVRTAAVLTPPNTVDREQLVAPARRYIEEGRREIAKFDPDLLRAYASIEADRLIDAIGDASTADFPGTGARLVEILLRGDNSLGSQYLAANIGQMPLDGIVWLLTLLPTLTVPTRAPLLRAAVASNIPAEMLKPAFIACGIDASQCTEEAITRAPAGPRQRLVTLLASFDDPRASAFLFDLLQKVDLTSEERRLVEQSIDLVAGSVDGAASRILVRSQVGLYRTYLKRAIDFSISLALLLFLVPTFLLFAIAVKFDSRGPLLMASRRWGYKGRHFSMWKFRTMRLDSDASADQIEFSSRFDARITRFGMLLRRTGLDALPSLFNVLCGDMAFVGPRPLPVHLVEWLGPVAKAVRTITRPGLVGPAQLDFSDFGSDLIEERAGKDLQYVADCSWWSDAKLLSRTIKAAALGSGAY